MTKMESHFGHNVVVARYTDGIATPVYSIECEDCYEVVFGEEYDDNL
jgi:hypothetical protein